MNLTHFKDYKTVLVPQVRLVSELKKADSNRPKQYITWDCELAGLGWPCADQYCWDCNL